MQGGHRENFENANNKLCLEITNHVKEGIRNNAAMKHQKVKTTGDRMARDAVYVRREGKTSGLS